MFSKLGIYEDDFLFHADFCCLYFWIDQIFVKGDSDNQNKVKPVSVVEVYTSKFFHSLFLLKI